jgi:hypothetical protein
MRRGYALSAPEPRRTEHHLPADIVRDFDTPDIVVRGQYLTAGDGCVEGAEFFFLR